MILNCVSYNFNTNDQILNFWKSSLLVFWKKFVFKKHYLDNLKKTRSHRVLKVNLSLNIVFCALNLKAGNNKRNKNYALHWQGYLRGIWWTSPISGNIYKERASSLTQFYICFVQFLDHNYHPFFIIVFSLCASFE